MVAAWKAERYFREGHYVALAAMRQAIAATGPSGAAAAKASRDAALAARRGALLNGISPVWRSVFEWLLDLPDTGSRLEAALKDDAKLIALAGLNDSERGAILSDLARLRFEYPDWRGGHATPPLERLDGLSRREDWQGIDSVGFAAWTKFAAVASMLVTQPVRLADAEMARLLTAAQDWRPLCDFGLLDLAGMTLQSGPAPRTVAALREMAVRPSHAVLPGNAGPERDGDVWWNGAPPRIKE